MRIVFIDGMGGGLVAQVISQAAGFVLVLPDSNDKNQRDTVRKQYLAKIYFLRNACLDFCLISLLILK